jgi:two-component system, chemotaxis family, CheB/CheR fusion protein
MRHSESGRALRVLVADDCRDFTDSLGLLLSLWGYEVCAAYDGAGALELAHDFRPDVALLDLGMPGLDGFALAECLRRLPGLEGVLLAAVTGYAREQDRVRAAEAGFAYYLVKPVEPATLEALLAARARRLRAEEVAAVP